MHFPSILLTFTAQNRDHIMSILDFVDKGVIILNVETSVAVAQQLLNTARNAYFILRDAEDFYLESVSKTLLSLESANPDTTIGHLITLHADNLLPVIDANTSFYSLKKNGKYIIRTSDGHFYYFQNKTRTDKEIEAPKSVPPAPAPISPPTGAGEDFTIGDIGEDFEIKMEKETMEEAAAPERALPSFEAYPSISKPEKVIPEVPFTIYVGFSKTLDNTLENVSKVVIDKPKENDFIQVSVMAIGAVVKDNRLKPLMLDVDAQTAFECVAGTGVEEITLIATYFYNMQPVGTATRRIKIGEEDNPTEKELDTVPAGCSLKLENLQYDNAMLDMTITITRDVVGKQLLWKIVAPNPEIDEHFQIPVEDTRSFAQIIGNELAKEGFRETGANNVLLTLGEQIAEIVPDALTDMLRAVHATIGRKPKVLIWTDEPYVPWELALLEDLDIDTDVPPFFCTQTIIGRWWLNDQVVCPPPSQMSVEELTAIAAEYPFGSKYRPLEEAIEEKKFLIQEFGANEVKATKKDLLKLTGRRDKTPGHWVHIALHGFSKPDKNEQSLAFEDGELSPMAMIGSYKCGEVPAISFLFLNACQVGTAGSSLGQASGFPGVLLKKGMLGFIAPLWQVHDEPAKEFSEAFYTETLQNGKEIGETLTNLKKAYDYEESLTPLAYIYYGHPALRITYDDAL